MSRERMSAVAIVPAAGYGKRLKMKAKKPLVSLKGKPIIAHTLSALEKCKEIDAVIIAVEKGCAGLFKDIVNKYAFRKVIDIVTGGKTRFDSVVNCLESMDYPYDIVVIHDGARPLVEPSLISRSVNLAARYGACIAALPESDTVKVVSKGLFIKKTLDRSFIYRAQTPQAFRYSVIRRAYARRGGKYVTDDASLVERAGVRVKILEGSYRNIKVTTREDLKIAEVLL